MPTDPRSPEEQNGRLGCDLESHNLPTKPGQFSIVISAVVSTVVKAHYIYDMCTYIVVLLYTKD